MPEGRHREDRQGSCRPVIFCSFLHGEMVFHER